MTTGREPLAEGREHLTVSGTFQSDKYPWCPAGFVALKLTDLLACDLLVEYAERHKITHRDDEFARDLLEALGPDVQVYHTRQTAALEQIANAPRGSNETDLRLIAALALARGTALLRGWTVEDLTTANNERHAKPILRVPGHDEPLMLESCEVIWLKNGRGCVWSVQDWYVPTVRQDEDFFMDETHFFVSAVYERELRDAVLTANRWSYVQLCERLVRGSGSEVKSYWQWYAQGCAETDPWEDDIEGPTPLHTWRAAAQYLQVGPWSREIA